MNLKDNEIRLAVNSDAAGMAVMSRDLIEHGLPWTWQESRIHKAIARNDTNCVVIAIEKELSGFAIAHFAEHTAHLALLAVLPECRRQGYGQHLVTWQEDVARTAGIQTFHLEVRADNLAAINFYIALGFQKTVLVKNYYSGQADALRMIRRF